ncbi:hypothetical protein Q5Y75_18900 [Ruegeria sp. 2205SS24-7]|uniref:hypothetical protein n=1 Tax=Ruegeria discodermiae TaxID=3064389 RepID=UPI0027403738|nr:hypothetical protein [Ruegeria sp. 2205SS24-7]MDP5219295.1 hypothetical protein [Ruegeria sp. 2205SS24-7]
MWYLFFMNMAKKQNPGVVYREVKTRYFAIAFAPVFIFLINTLITNHLFATDIDVPTDILQTERPWLEAVGRHRFLAATWFFAALAIFAVAMLIRNLARPTAPKTRVVAIATLLIILLLALVPTIQQSINPDGSRVYHRLGAAFFEAALSRGGLPGCVGPDDLWLLGRCGEIPAISLFNRIIDIVNVLAGLSVGALVVGMVLCLETRDGDDIEDQAALLAGNLKQMRQQLYVSSIVLTFGMLFATSWMYWPLPLVKETEQAAYSALVLASALFSGTYFSLLMLSFYLPVALILDGRTRRLAEKVRQGARPDEPLNALEWRKARGLQEGAVDYLRAGFAVTAPILAAFAGGISPIAL